MTEVARAHCDEGQGRKEKGPGPPVPCASEVGLLRPLLGRRPPSPAAPLTPPCSLQHQQQVAQAVERAKQVTMTELNAIIGVRGLPNLPLTVCIALLIPLIYHDQRSILILAGLKERRPQDSGS